MKKILPKTIVILEISIVFILISILIYQILDLLKVDKNKKEVQVVSMQENIQEYIQDNSQENSDKEVIVVYLNNIQITENNEEQVTTETNTENNEQAITHTNTVNNSSSVESNYNNTNIQNQTDTEDTNKYYIKVNCGANVVTIYTKDLQGNYTVPYKAMICSTGTATPRYLGGKYEIKSRWEWGALFGGVYGHYCVYIVDQILFHSVPYLSNSPDTLEYWEYDKLRNFSISRMYKVNCSRCKMDI